MDESRTSPDSTAIADSPAKAEVERTTDALIRPMLCLSRSASAARLTIVRELETVAEVIRPRIGVHERGRKPSHGASTAARFQAAEPGRLAGVPWISAAS